VTLISYVELLMTFRPFSSIFRKAQARPSNVLKVSLRQHFRDKQV
jgi:hypothetical protein